MQIPLEDLEYQRRAIAAVVDGVLVRSKAPSPLRSAGALQNSASELRATSSFSRALERHLLKRHKCRAPESVEASTVPLSFGLTLKH